MSTAHTDSHAAEGSGAAASRSPEGWTFAIGISTGALGILSGYCIFLLWQKQAAHGEGWTFALALGVAALAAFTVEYFREVIKEGHLESLSVPRVMVTLVTLMMFELVVMAWHGLPEIEGKEWGEIPAKLLGPALAGTGRPVLNLAVMAGLWVIAGIALAVTLGQTVIESQSWPLQRQMLAGGKRGFTAGAVVAPIGALIWVLVFRVVAAVYAMIADHDNWRLSLERLAAHPSPLQIANGERGPSYGWAFDLFLWIDSLFARGWWGPLLGVAILVALVTLVIRSGFNYVSVVITLAAGWVIFGPVFADLGTLVLVPVLTAIVWCVPGLMLGLAAPLLRKPSEQPREWGIVALVAAVVLIAVTWSGFRFWFLLPAVLLLVAGIYFRRGVSIEDYWPIVALSVGIIICGAVWVIQWASFAGVLEKVHQINSLAAYSTAPPAREPLIPLNRLRVSTPMMSLDESDRLLEKIRATTQPATRPTSRPFGGTSSLLFPPATSPSFRPTTVPTLERSIDDVTGRLFAPATTNSVEPHAEARAHEEAHASSTQISGHGPAPSLPAHAAAESVAGHGETGEGQASGACSANGCDCSGHECNCVKHGEEDPKRAARRLELSIAGSLGFWTTVGLLATWSLQRRKHGAAHG